MANQNSSKTNFFFGLATGIAVVSLIGFFAMTGLYLNKDANLAQVADTTGDTVPENGGNDDVGDDNGPDIAINSESNIKGNSDAQVTIVEYSDFQCSFCARFYSTIKQALDSYKDKVRVVYKHFPLDSIHPQARPAAEASECAAEQDRFWDFHDALFENQSKLGKSYYLQLASDFGLNTSQFEDCVNTRKYKDKVEADYREGIQVGIRGTPGSFVNGTLVSGAVPYETLDAAIQEALSK
jgi:protein-disulfide isomerase